MGGFGIAEIVFFPVMMLLAFAPFIVVVWLLVVVHRMSRDLADVAKAARYLADRAAREDGLRP